MFNLLKESLQLSNLFLLVIIILLISTYYYTFKKTRWLWYLVSLLFLVASTNIVPSWLIARYEAKTPICNPTTLNKNETYYIHVLGAGCSYDPRLPATSQLGLVTLGRLVEAVRIINILPSYKLVTSGSSRLGLESQASVVRRAATELGIPAENSCILSIPTNTAEEVSAFVKEYGIQKKVILVSDALHLPRALMLYKKAGIQAIGAPTNFTIKKGITDYNGLSLPSWNSLNNMSLYLRENLKYWKDNL